MPLYPHRRHGFRTIKVSVDMTLPEFEASLSIDTPPDGMDKALLALWQDIKGNWNAAHKIAQSTGDSHGDWVHAYLHRKEGDISNAKYWYSRADRKVSTMSFEDERKQIVEQILACND